MSSIIFTDQFDPDGRVIHYNVDKPTGAIAREFNLARSEDMLLEVPNEKPGEEPIFVNPDHIATVTPTRKERH